ncbi:hypothetical protein R1flu_007229 [Riccia fluitans]|uniref:Uncharacterized protein n=1 Tax=Riccia fluitans TaxID=41844 RepID=A0ABD1YY89_9MARC
MNSSRRNSLHMSRLGSPLVKEVKEVVAVLLITPFDDSSRAYGISVRGDPLSSRLPIALPLLFVACLSGALTVCLEAVMMSPVCASLRSGKECIASSSIYCLTVGSICWATRDTLQENDLLELSEMPEVTRTRQILIRVLHMCGLLMNTA